MSGECRSEYGGYSDGVLVDVRPDVVWADGVFAWLQWHDQWFHVEVAAELLPHHMHVAAEYQVQVRWSDATGRVLVGRRTARKARRRALGRASSEMRHAIAWAASTDPSSRMSVPPQDR
ncbi:MAG TPA: hypothetical protein VI030_03365 [Propionibacteriaceae bacterium]